MQHAPDSTSPAAPDAVASELMMARASLRVGLPLALGSLAIVYPWRGAASAATALGAVALVVGNFYLTGRSLAWAAKKSLAVLQGVALGGLLARLVLYAVLIVVLDPVEAIDGPVLAVTTAIATVVLLTYETRFVLATSQLWWLDPRAAGSAPARAVVGDATTAGSHGHGKERP